MSSSSKYILFLDDWRKHPKAIIHEETKNTSWLYHSDVYAALGVKNHFWHLALMDRDLVNVDPHDPGIDAIMATKIRTECIRNPQYFFREVLRIPNNSVEGYSSFTANRGNLAAIWCFFNNIDYLLIMIRQKGKSIVDDSEDIYVLIFGSNININKLTKDASLRKANVQRLKKIRDLLPSYLNLHDKQNDKDNEEEITCKANKTHIRFFVGQSNEDAANKTARGHTAPINRADEPPFTSFAHVSIPAMVTSGNTAREIARENDTFYCTSYTTTAGKIDTAPGEFMYRLKEDAFYFKETLYDCQDKKHAHKRIVANAPGGAVLVNITMGYKQLGHDARWVKRTILENRMSPEEADRDVFNRWTSGNVSHPLNQDLLSTISGSETDPLWYDTLENEFVVYWYVSKNELSTFGKNRKIIIGQDSSNAIGKDAMTMVFVDEWSGGTIASIKVSETNIHNYSEMIGKLMVENDFMILNPENRGQGQSVIDGVITILINNGINPIFRIYNTIVDSDDWDDVKSEWTIPPMLWNAKMQSQFKRSCGFTTSANGRHSRNALYMGTFTYAAEIAAYSMNDQRLIGEISTLQKKNDRIDHPLVGHDDMVVAWMLAHWMLMHSKNLSAYGISKPYHTQKRWVPSGTIVDDSPRNSYLTERQKVIKAQIDDLIELLSSIRCPYTSMAMERKIRMLNSSLGDTGPNLAQSIDELINKAKARRDGSD